MNARKTTDWPLNIGHFLSKDDIWHVYFNITFAKRKALIKALIYSLLVCVARGLFKGGAIKKNTQKGEWI